MAEPIPVTLRHEYIWRPGLDMPALCDMLMYLSEPHFRMVKSGAVDALRLDTESRREDVNAINTEKDDVATHTRRCINKGLAMELVSSAVFAMVDHPQEVKSFCKLNARRQPNYFAPPGYPDILITPNGGPPRFQIVCEVSANREANTESCKESWFKEQLEGALEHAEKWHKQSAVDVTYALLVSTARIAEDKVLHKVFRDFVTKSKHKLAPSGSIRFAAIRAEEFVTALQRINAAGNLSFKSRLLARGLDLLHERLYEETLPEEEDWMAKLLVETVAAGVHPNENLFDGGPS